METFKCEDKQLYVNFDQNYKVLAKSNVNKFNQNDDNSSKQNYENLNTKNNDTENLRNYSSPNNNFVYKNKRPSTFDLYSNVPKSNYIQPRSSSFKVYKKVFSRAQSSSSSSSLQNSIFRLNNLQYQNNEPSLPLSVNSLKKMSSTNLSYPTFDSNCFIEPDSYLHLTGVESVTSSSFLHGFILVLIILLSIVAFVLSKLKDACEDFYLSDTLTSCYQISQWLFSSMLLITSLFGFIVYFLHLIGQCDYVDLKVKRKVFFEICITLFITILLLTSNIFLILTTVAIFNQLNLISLALSFFISLLYIIRVYLLFREYRMLNDKPIDYTEMSFNKNEQTNKNEDLDDVFE